MTRSAKYLAFAGLLALLALPLMSATGTAQGLDTNSFELPPDGVYISPDEYHKYTAMGIVLDDPSHYRFTNIHRDAVGTDEVETFDSAFSATVWEADPGTGEPLNSLGQVVLTGPVQVRTTNRNLSATGTFATEIVSMSLSGNSPMGFVEIREDMQRASTGQTDIQDLGGGLYHIDSFFDVFTELRVGGATGMWIPCDDSTRMYLTPEPGTLVLFGMGVLGLLALVRRRRRAA